MNVSKSLEIIGRVRASILQFADCGIGVPEIKFRKLKKCNRIRIYQIVSENIVLGIF